MVLVKFEIFVGHDDELAGESVFHGVHGRSLFAGFGFGAGGVQGVGSVDFGAIGCRHFRILC